MCIFRVVIQCWASDFQFGWWADSAPKNTSNLSWKMAERHSRHTSTPNRVSLLSTHLTPSLQNIEIPRHTKWNMRNTKELTLLSMRWRQPASWTPHPPCRRPWFLSVAIVATVSSEWVENRNLFLWLDLREYLTHLTSLTHQCNSVNFFTALYFIPILTLTTVLPRQ